MRSSLNRLKPKEVAGQRKEMLEKQKGLCALCGLEVTEEQATLDHCHDTGHIRGVLHRNCNQIDGRILSWARRSGVSPIQFLKALIELWEGDYSQNPLHPNGTSAQQKELRRLRRKIRVAKRKETRDRLREEKRRVFD